MPSFTALLAGQAPYPATRTPMPKDAAPDRACLPGGHVAAGAHRAIAAGEASQQEKGKPKGDASWTWQR
jgi:hypothetical protein